MKLPAPRRMKARALSSHGSFPKNGYFPTTLSKLKIRYVKLKSYLARGNMRILLTGYKGYIGAVAGPILHSAGHEVVGLDSDLFAGCEFGEPAPEISEI